MRLRLLLVVLALTSYAGTSGQLEGLVREGDLVFQTSGSSQSQAIQLATHSPFSHMGLLFRRHNKWMVCEAEQTVRFTPLDDWVKHGIGGHFVVMRLSDTAPLTPLALKRMREIAESFQGKQYDLYFDWSDGEMYCSELVWKIYKRGAGVEIGKLQRLGDFDLSSTIVREKMRERFGRHVPLDEPVISPAAMFNSAKLMEVIRR